MISAQTLSNSASPPRTVNIKRPCAVVVSAHASAKDRKRAFFSVIASVAVSLGPVRGPAHRGRRGRHRRHLGGGPAGDQLRRRGAA
jgi:hypothetical protein